LLDGLKHSLITAEADYMRSTGKTFKAEDFADDSVLNMDDVRGQAPQKQPFGFTPSTAQGQPLFKYQQPQKQPMGFINTDTLPTHQAPAKKATSAKLGSAETQLNIPEFGRAELSTYNRELAGHGIHSPDDKALDKAANQADIQRIIDKGLGTAEPPVPGTQKTTSKVPAGGLPEVPEKSPSKPPAGGADGLYGRWLNAVKSGECRPSVDGTWKWIQKRTTAKESGKSSFHRSHISNMQKGFFSRAIHDGLMTINPGYKRGGKKYIWIGEQANG
jgi:hypothetical protein